MPRTNRRRLRRAEFVDSEAFADALRAGGGPGPNEIDDLTHLMGESGEILRAAWGHNQAAYDAAVEAEVRAEQRARPHIFRATRTGGYRRQKR